LKIQRFIATNNVHFEPVNTGFTRNARFDAVQAKLKVLMSMLDPNQIAKFRQQTATPRKRSVAGSWTRLCGTCKQPAIIRGGKTRKVGGRTVFTCAGCLIKLMEKPDGEEATSMTGTDGG
jgi:hypothetical protein